MNFTNKRDKIFLSQHQYDLSFIQAIICFISGNTCTIQIYLNKLHSLFQFKFAGILGIISSRKKSTGTVCTLTYCYIAFFVICRVKKNLLEIPQTTFEIKLETIRGLPSITYAPRGRGGVKSPIHFYCVFHAKRGGGGPESM